MTHAHQEDLFTSQPYHGVPPHEDTPTSIAAALEIAPVAATLREQVFSAIAKAGAWGMTDEEIGDQLHMGGNTVRPRRRELVLLARVSDSNQVRKTRSGRGASVWVAV